MEYDNVCIVSGFLDNQFSEYESEIQKFYGKHCDLYKAREKSIHFCSGCFDCWIKTPGICSEKDDMPEILSSIINSQLTVFVSTVRMGFLTALLKKCMDKMIPLLSPYFDKIQNECHHAARYPVYPAFALILFVDNKVNQIETDIITEVFKRFAINFRSYVRFIYIHNIETSNIGRLHREIAAV